jgi:sarcosine oxidase gamma subunit
MIIDPLPHERMLEVVALRLLPEAANFPPEWPTVSGAVWYGAGGRPVILHCASGRWLVTMADAIAEKLVQATVGARCCEAIDLAGKWLGLHLSGSDVKRALASSADTAAMLGGHDCASTTLFDCPVVVAKGTRDYYVWVKRSYSTDLLASLREHAASPA